MRKIIMLICLLAAFSANAELKYSLIEVPVSDNTTYEDLAGMGMDIIEYDNISNMFKIVAAPSDLFKLSANGFTYTVEIDDMAKFYASRLNQYDPMGGYHTYDETVDEIFVIHNAFPNIVSAPYSIGQSLQGRELWVIRVSDNPEIDEDEPEIFYNGLIHAREPIGIEIQLNFLHYLTDNYLVGPEITDLVDNREMYFLPIINPDGYARNEETNPQGGGMWRKNMSDNNNSGYFEEAEDGVDLNRNFSYMWGYDDIGSSPEPSSATYRGPEAFSEPEVSAIRDFVNSREFTIALFYHAYGNKYVHSWGYDFYYTDAQDVLSEMGWTMAEYNNFTTGPSWLNLYTVNGAANDWMYGDSSHSEIISYTVEVGAGGDGFWPEEYRIPILCAENLETNIVAAMYADDPWRILKPNPPVITPVDTVEGEFTLSWNPNSDGSNPPVSYDVRELTGREVSVNYLESVPGDEFTADGFVWNSSMAHSGFFSYFSGSVNSANSRLTITEPYEVNMGDIFSFWTWYDIDDDDDYGYVQVSQDGGYSFENLEGNITTNYDPNGKNLGNGITGTSNSWEQGVFDLSDYAEQTVIISFLYKTDSWSLGDGWHIDDISPWVSYDSINVIAENVTDTSIVITPGGNTEHVYYQVRANDGEEDISLWSDVEEIFVTGLKVAESGYRPTEFRFNGIYPNPFNPAAAIDFQLSVSASTTIDIFNIEGRTVQHIDLGVLEPGRHIFGFDGSMMTSGVYFVRLQSGEKNSLKKVLLLK